MGDGSQIEEVMLTYLALDKYGVDYIAFAPNKMQYDVINHYTEKVQSEERNILIEAARIGRGRIKDIKDVKSEEIDTIILPGGLGVFVNLVYVIETAILLGLTSEKEVLPIFRELYGIRKTLDEDARSKLENIRKRLRSIMHTKNGEVL